MKKSQINANIEALLDLLKVCSKFYPEYEAGPEELLRVAAVIELCEEFRPRLEAVSAEPKARKKSDFHLQAVPDELLCFVRNPRPKLTVEQIKAQMELRADLPRKHPLKSNPEPKPIKAHVPEVPYGTFGMWDYANADWPRQPTLADVPEICAQKQFRYPENKFWQNEDDVKKWLVAKGLV